METPRIPITDLFPNIDQGKIREIQETPLLKAIAEVDNLVTKYQENPKIVTVLRATRDQLSSLITPKTTEEAMVFVAAIAVTNLGYVLTENEERIKT